MIDHTYACTTAGCAREGRPTGARWCVACGTPTRPEPPALPDPVPAGDPGGPARPGAGPGEAAPGRPLLSPEWRQSFRTAAVAAGAMLAFSLLWVGLLAALAADGDGPTDNLASLLRFAVTLVPLSMHGALVVDGSVAAASAGDDQGHLSLVPPVLLGAVVGLAVLAVTASRRVRQAPPRAAGPFALEALRTGAAFAGLMGATTFLTFGTVQDAGTGRVSWHVGPVGVAWWSLLLGTLAGGLGGTAAVVRTGHSRELLAGASPAQRGWLRALGGGMVAAGTGLALGTVAVAVLAGVGLSRYAAATEASFSFFQVSPWLVAGLAALFLPVAAIQALGLGMGATVVAGSSGDAAHAGYLAGSGLPGWAYLLLLVPALAVLAGGLWTAAREQADPEPQPAGWLRFAAATTALFGLLLVLARFKAEGSTGGVSSAWSLLQAGGQDRVSAVAGIRLADGLLLAFGWAALGGVAAERLFPVLLRRYGRGLARVRGGRLGLLPAPPTAPAAPGRAAAPRRPARALGALAAVAAVAIAGIWLGTGRGPDGSATAEALAPTSTAAVTEPTLGAPSGTLPGPGSSPAGAGGPAGTGTDTAAAEGPPAELAGDATASASETAPDSVDAAGSPISYSAGNLTDGDPQTAWRVAGNGRGVTVTLTLPSAAHLTRVGLIPGYAKVDPSNGVDRFPENRRVREVRWRFDDGTTVDQRFADTPDMQEIAVDITTRSVTIEVLGTRPGTPDHDYVPISEVSLVGTSR